MSLLVPVGASSCFTVGPNSFPPAVHFHLGLFSSDKEYHCVIPKVMVMQQMSILEQLGIAFMRGSSSEN